MRFKRALLSCVAVAGVVALGTMAGPRHAIAQTVRAALVRDADLGARQPFQTTVAINFNNPTISPVTIPAGKRLVVEYVSVTGAAASNQGGIQPVVLLYSMVNNTPWMNYYLSLQQSTTAPSQFYHSEMMKVYADQFSVGFAYAGYTPSYLVANVMISGHLIDIVP